VTLGVATYLLNELGLSSLDWEDWFPRPRLPPWDDPHKVTRYSDAALQPLRQRGDPATDTLISKIAGPGPKGRQGKAVHDFFHSLISEDYFVATHFRSSLSPAVYQELLAWTSGTVHLPGNLDRKRIKRAAEFFKDHLFAIGVVLSTSSLLEGYACRRGVQVLHRAGRLSHFTNRRLAETLRFVLFVTAPEGFTIRGHAVEAIQKVRLMHGAIRWLTRNDDWDEAEFGVPVNREDLLGVLMSFSTLVFRDLPKLMIPVSYEEADDFRYLWNVVGGMLGNEASFLPNSVGESLALTMAIERRQQESSLEGVDMAAALVKYHRHFLKEWVDSVGVLVMRWLAGDAVCDMVGIAPFAFGAGMDSLEVLGTVRDWGIEIWSHGDETIGGVFVKQYPIPPSLAGLWSNLDDMTVGWNGA
jgi:hypothetical protein